MSNRRPQEACRPWAWLIFDVRQEMSSRIVPLSIRAASLGILIFPTIVCVIGFRLYAHPNNPDAWFILGVLEVVYGIGALLIWKGFGFVRWLWALSLAATIILGAGRIIAIWRSPYSSLVAGVSLALVGKGVLLGLLFVPSANAFFRGEKEPNKAPEPTPTSVTPPANSR